MHADRAIYCWRDSRNVKRLNEGGRNSSTLVLHRTYHVDSLPAFTATPIRSLKQQSTKVACLKLKRLFVILKVTLCFDHNIMSRYVYDHVTISTYLFPGVRIVLHDT